MVLVVAYFSLIEQGSVGLGLPYKRSRRLNLVGTTTFGQIHVYMYSHTQLTASDNRTRPASCWFPPLSHRLLAGQSLCHYAADKNIKYSIVCNCRFRIEGKYRNGPHTHICLVVPTTNNPTPNGCSGMVFSPPTSPPTAVV
jgi:hypothetical protein